MSLRSALADASSLHPRLFATFEAASFEPAAQRKLPCCFE
jgi:hypothetical protein